MSIECATSCASCTSLHTPARDEHFIQRPARGGACLALAPIMSTEEPAFEIVPPAGTCACAFEQDRAHYVVVSYPLEAPRALPASLTAAERGVAGELLGGAALKEIAARRNTSPRTVANQARAIYRKLGVGSRLELAVLMRAEEGT